MIKSFHINTGKKVWKFESIQSLEDFILHNKAFLKKQFISLIDENNNNIGIISVDSYIKYLKHDAKTSK